MLRLVVTYIFRIRYWEREQHYNWCLLECCKSVGFDTKVAFALHRVVFD